MVSTPRINEHDPRSLALLTSDQEFVLFAAPATGDDWVEMRVSANFAQVTRSGALEFWNVVDNVWHQVSFYAHGWWANYAVVKKREPVSAPDAPPQDLDDVDPVLTANPSLQGTFGVPRGRDELEEIRAQIRLGLSRGVYPSAQETGGVEPPKRVKDIWEGKGDPADDGTEEDSWPRNGTQEEIDAWVAKQEAREQAVAEQLRAESDAVLDRDTQLPEHLRDDFPVLPTPAKVPTIMEEWHGKATS